MELSKASVKVFLSSCLAQGGRMPMFLADALTSEGSLLRSPIIVVCVLGQRIGWLKTENLRLRSSSAVFISQDVYSFFLTARGSVWHPVLIVNNMLVFNGEKMDEQWPHQTEELTNIIGGSRANAILDRLRTVERGLI